MWNSACTIYFKINIFPPFLPVVNRFSVYGFCFIYHCVCFCANTLWFVVSYGFSLFLKKKKIPSLSFHWSILAVLGHLLFSTNLELVYLIALRNLTYLFNCIVSILGEKCYLYDNEFSTSEHGMTSLSYVFFYVFQ